MRSEGKERKKRYNSEAKDMDVSDCRQQQQLHQCCGDVTFEKVSNYVSIVVGRMPAPTVCQYV